MFIESALARFPSSSGTSLRCDYNVLTKQRSGVTPFTFQTATPSGYSQSETFFYIPKNTPYLDFEIWDDAGGKTLTLYNAIPPAPGAVSRVLNVSAIRGTKSYALAANEQGTIAKLQANGFAFPYLYSVPQLWAKSPSTLLIPRAIAQRDGLTVMGP